MNLVAAVAALIMLPLTNRLTATVFWIIAGSVVLHCGYKLILARLYRAADLGQAYPLARGLTPLIAMAIAFFAMGEIPGSLAIAGIGLICGGLALLALEGRGQLIFLPTLSVALTAGTAVAGYTVVDAYGIRMTGDVLSYTVWLVLLDGFAFVGYTVATRREQALRAWTAEWGRVLISGLFGIISFGVFMWALSRSPVGAVSALRETSVLFAAMIGTFLLRERATWMRYTAAFAVAVGVGAIALAR